MVIKIELEYIIKENEEGFKISKILRDKLYISSRLLTKLKMNEKILVNEVPVFSNYLVHFKDNVKVKIDFTEEDNIVPEKINLNIIYEDDYFLAVDKSAGMVVHPSNNHFTRNFSKWR